MAIDQDASVTTWSTEDGIKLVVVLEGGGSETTATWRIEEFRSGRAIATVNKLRPEGEFSGWMKLAPTNTGAMFSYLMAGEDQDNLDAHVQAIWDTWSAINP